LFRFVLYRALRVYIAIHKSLFKNYIVHMEQSETWRNLFGKVKSSNDKSNLHFSCFHRIRKLRYVIDIIRNIMFFASQNRSKPNDCHRCKRV